MNQYLVYILKCADGSYYTGVTHDLERRMWEHETGYNKKSYTYNRRPVKLVFYNVFNDINQAIAFEKQIKGWKRVKKEALINNDWAELVKLSNHKKNELELIEHLKKINLDSPMVRLTHHDKSLTQYDKSSNQQNKIGKNENVTLSSSLPAGTVSKGKTVSTYKAFKYKDGNSDSSMVRLTHHDKSIQKVEDELVVEESLLINVNFKPFTLTMRSPGSEEELVRGLLFTENIIPLGTDYKFNITEKKNGIITAVNVEVDEKHIQTDLLDKRNLLSVSSCGICGKLELNQKCEHLSPIETSSKLKIENLSEMFAQMSNHQEIFKKTGGCHASAAFDKNGNLLSIKEDIGRHNAVDKVIGELILKQNLQKACCILVSGRISYEIVSKVYMARIPFLAAVSSVSSLAVDLADEYGITMLGFCRDGKATCYTNNERII